VDRQIIDYLPPVLAGLREVKHIMNAEQPELELLWKNCDNALDDQFIEDMTINGIGRWETMLDIMPSATDTIDTRRFRIRTKLNEKLPFTLQMLRRSLRSLCGRDGYTVQVNPSNFTVIVRIALFADENFQDVKDLLKRMIPANMIIDLSFQYNTNNNISKYTYGELKNHTHYSLRNEVNI